MKLMYRLASRIVLAAPVLAVLMVAAMAQTAAPAAPLKIDSGDTAWMLTSTALVLMMTVPGLALFYGGMVRKMNVLATVMQSFAVTCLVTVLWMIIGYSLAFTEGTPSLGGLRRRPRGAHHLRRRRADGGAGDGQAARLWQRADGAAQSGVQRDRRLAAVG